MSEVRLLQGDCLELMRSLPAGSVVLVTDPPYGIGESNRKNLSRANMAASIDYGDFDWDSEPITPECLRLMLAVSREQVIFGGNYYADQLPPSPSWIVWDKQNGANDFADCELAWTSHKKAVRIYRYMWNGMIKQRPEKRYHPTQKPLALMKWVVENYTQPGDTILDPFMGSGTTGVACVELGRSFIGIERASNYFEIASRRITEAQAQMRMPL